MSRDGAWIVKTAGWGTKKEVTDIPIFCKINLSNLLAKNYESPRYAIIIFMMVQLTEF